jgi:hypothetical protein
MLTKVGMAFRVVIFSSFFNNPSISNEHLAPAATGARCLFEILGLLKNDENIKTFSEGQMVHTVIGRPEAGF